MLPMLKLKMTVFKSLLNTRTPSLFLKVFVIIFKKHLIRGPVEANRIASLLVPQISNYILRFMTPSLSTLL